MKSARGGSLGTLVAAAGVVVIAWLGLRSMNEAQKKAAAPTTDAQLAAPLVSSGVTMVPPIPPPILASASSSKTPIARLDVTLRVDGLDLTLDGAQACRNGSKRMVGRDPGGAVGSFDESALTGCVTLIRGSRPEARVVALVGRAGPAVPTTFVDALVSALKRAGIADVVVTP